MTLPVILYHAKCQDGLGAKYAAWHKFRDNAVYIPVNYNEPVPEKVYGKSNDIYIIDFSYPKDVLLDIQSKVNSIVVLDHHKTAKEALEGLDFAHFDMDKSGAVLAWEYFHPGTPIPGLLTRIMDRDIWKWQYKDTTQVLAMVSLAEEDFSKWDDLEAIGPEAVAKMGQHVVAYQDLCVKQAMDYVRVVKWRGYDVAVINSTHMTSEVGNQLCKTLDVDFAIVWSMYPIGVVYMGFRSVGDFDVSAIAKTFGGGGHKNAAGASAPISILNEFYGE